MSFASSIIISICRIWYTTYCTILLLVGYFAKGSKLFEKRVRSKPQCLDNWNSRFLKLKHIRLHYVQTGEDDKPLMLFVHGYPEFWYSWRFQLREFQKNYRCVAIDQRGYNLSDKPKLIEQYKIEELVNDLKAVIEELGYKSAILVAHDWGGNVAWTFAECYPEMVDKLIVCNIPRPSVFAKYIQSSWAQFRKSWYIFFYQSEQIPELMNCCDDMKMLEMSFRSEKMGIRNKENFTDEDLEAWKYAFSQNGASFRYPINYYRNIFNKKPQKGKEQILKMPVLIIWGTADGALESEMATLSLKKLENGHLEFLENGSHWIQQDQPERVNELIWKFVGK